MAPKVLALSSGKIDKYENFTGEEILFSIQRQIIKQAKSALYSLGRALGKQTEKQVGALKPLGPSNNNDELKQIESMFPQDLMNDLVCAKLKETANLEDIIKADELYYKSRRKKVL